MTSIGKGALLFLGGVLFGTAGIKALSSKDAKKAYTHCTAAALRAKDSVMETVTKVQENAGDIYAEAKQINLDREESEKPIELELEPEKPVEANEETVKAADEDEI
ncbi:MAG: DUF6110 family protein [Ruminococcus sp.]|nr:DUF6110 family protein [Ruminococcus sp.]